jgi:hypothetical protein
VVGKEEAAVLIDHLPPGGWSDVVRKRDLDDLSARLDERFARIDDRFALLDERFLTMEARVDLSLQRALREQTNRFLLGTSLILGAFVSLIVYIA